MTQIEMILRHMQEGHTITPFEALEEYGCFRLASRICDIEKMGIRVDRAKVSRKNRFGKTVTYKKYWIERA